MIPVTNQSVRTSTSNGRKTERKVLELFTNLHFTCTAQRKDTKLQSPYGDCFPDLLVTLPSGEKVYVECKSNSPDKGTLYQKLWYTVDVYNQLGVKVLIVLDTKNHFIKTTALDRLKQLSSDNVTWVLMEDLEEWASRKCAAVSLTALAKTVMH